MQAKPAKKRLKSMKAVEKRITWKCCVNFLIFGSRQELKRQSLDILVKLPVQRS